jgi:hypothetical protein
MGCDRRVKQVTKKDLVWSDPRANTAGFLLVCAERQTDIAQQASVWGNEMFVSANILTVALV